MKKLLATVLLSSFMCFGCVHQASSTGNFSDKEVKNYYSNMSTISDDSTNKLIGVFPPAKTHLKMTQAIEKNDVFGLLFLNGLRQQGYAIQEYSEKAQQTEVEISDYYNISYVLKNAKGDKKSYELILNIGNYRLARTYIVDKQGEVQPASSWTMRN